MPRQKPKAKNCDKQRRQDQTKPSKLAFPIEKLKWPISIFIITAATLIVTVILLSRRDYQNVTIKPLPESAVSAFSHTREEWGKLSANAHKQYEAWGNFTGSVTLSPQQDEQVLNLTIQSLQLEAIHILTKKDTTSPDGYEIVQSQPADGHSTIVVTASRISFHLGFDAQQVRIMADASGFGIGYTPNAIVVSSSILGSGQEETNIVQPSLSLVAKNGDTAFIVAGMGETQIAFGIDNTERISINGQAVSAPRSTRLVLSLSDTTEQPTIWNFRNFVIQGDFGLADIFLDTKNTIEFYTLLPIAYFQPPTGSLIIGAQPESELLPGQNELEVHARDNSPLAISFLARPSERMQSEVAGQSDYVLLNATKQLIMTRWETLPVQIQVLIAGTFIAAFAFAFREAYKKMQAESE